MSTPRRKRESPRTIRREERRKKITDISPVRPKIKIRINADTVMGSTESPVSFSFSQKDISTP